MRPTPSSLSLVASVGAVLLTVSACGGGESGSGTPAASGDAATPVTVQAGFIPVIDVAALYLGDEQGFFADHGIDLEVNVGQGGAALVPSVVSGEYQFAFSNTVSLLTARAQGLPLQVIAAGSTSTGEEGADVSMIHVPADSPIQTAADLEGRTVSVNTLGNLLEMLGRVGVDAAGGDPDAVDFVELPFPDAISSLQNGTIDAMVGAEPFGTIAADSGARVISSPYAQMSPDPMMTSAYFTSEQQLAENPELFEQLTAAIDESLEFAQENPDLVRQTVADYTEIDPAVLDRLILPTFSPEVPQESIDVFIEYATQFGFIDGDVTYEDLVWEGARS